MVNGNWCWWSWSENQFLELDLSDQNIRFYCKCVLQCGTCTGLGHDSVS